MDDPANDPLSSHSCFLRGPLRCSDLRSIRCQVKSATRMRGRAARRLFCAAAACISSTIQYPHLHYEQTLHTGGQDSGQLALRVKSKRGSKQDERKLSSEKTASDNRSVVPVSKLFRSLSKKSSKKSMEGSSKSSPPNIDSESEETILRDPVVHSDLSDLQVEAPVHLGLSAEIEPPTETKLTEDGTDAKPSCSLVRSSVANLMGTDKYDQVAAWIQSGWTPVPRAEKSDLAETSPSSRGESSAPNRTRRESTSPSWSRIGSSIPNYSRSGSKTSMRSRSGSTTPATLSSGKRPPLTPERRPRSLNPRGPQKVEGPSSLSSRSRSTRPALSSTSWRDSFSSNKDGEPHTGPSPKKERATGSQSAPSKAGRSMSLRSWKSGTKATARSPQERAASGLEGGAGRENLSFLQTRKSPPSGEPASSSKKVAPRVSSPSPPPPKKKKKQATGSQSAPSKAEKSMSFRSQKRSTEATARTPQERAASGLEGGAGRENLSFLQTRKSPPPSEPASSSGKVAPRVSSPSPPPPKKKKQATGSQLKPRGARGSVTPRKPKGAGAFGLDTHSCTSSAPSKGQDCTYKLVTSEDIDWNVKDIHQLRPHLTIFLNLMMWYYFRDDFTHRRDKITRLSFAQDENCPKTPSSSSSGSDTDLSNASTRTAVFRKWNEEKRKKPGVESSLYKIWLEWGERLAKADNEERLQAEITLLKKRVRQQKEELCRSCLGLARCIEQSGDHDDWKRFEVKHLYRLTDDGKGAVIVMDVKDENDQLVPGVTIPFGEGICDYCENQKHAKSLCPLHRDIHALYAVLEHQREDIKKKNGKVPFQKLLGVALFLDCLSLTQHKACDIADRCKFLEDYRAWVQERLKNFSFGAKKWREMLEKYPGKKLREALAKLYGPPVEGDVVKECTYWSKLPLDCKEWLKSDDAKGFERKAYTSREQLIAICNKLAKSLKKLSAKA